MAAGPGVGAARDLAGGVVARDLDRGVAGWVKGCARKVGADQRARSPSPPLRACSGPGGSDRSPQEKAALCEPQCNRLVSPRGDRLLSLCDCV